MRPMRKYLPPLATLLLTALGAAMPWLTARAQDARIGRLQERLELAAVNLTLRQDTSVWPALQVVSREHTAIPWTDEARMTSQEALDTAAGMVSQMSDYDLLPTWQAELLAIEEGSWAEPALLVAGDGSTALVWYCNWKALSCMVVVDDASGKAVQFQFLLEDVSWPQQQEQKNISHLTGQWDLFFRDYYGVELTDTAGLPEHPGNGETAYQYELTIADLEDSEAAAPGRLRLQIYGSYISFNC